MKTLNSKALANFLRQEAEPETIEQYIRDLEDVRKNVTPAIETLKALLARKTAGRGNVSKKLGWQDFQLPPAL
jgi:hypothetical protein